MKKVSIIVPAYNSEKYIDQCLNSLINQTYPNIEILVINDGSTDDTERKIKHYLGLDSRIVIYTNINHGVSYSRNFGVEKSNGDYIAFVDSDDYVSLDFIETLVKSIDDFNADMSAVAVYKEAFTDHFYFSSGEAVRLSGEEIFTGLFGKYEGFLCNKLYKRKIIEENNIFFNVDTSICEDLLFNVEYLEKCESVAYNLGEKYYYRQNIYSATNNLNNCKWFDILYAYLRILELLKNHENAYRIAIGNYALCLCEADYRYRFLFNNTPDERERVEQYIKNGHKLIRDNYRIISSNNKLKILLFKLFPKIVMKYKRRNIREQ